MNQNVRVPAPIVATATTLALALTLALSCLLSAAPAGAIIEDPDVDTFAAYEYRIDPERGAVDVTIELAVTADKPNRTLNNGNYYEYYFPGYFLAVPENAVDLTVADANGRELRFSINDENEGFHVLEINFRRNIFYRQTADVVVSYSLPEGVARSEVFARVNEAYAGFEVWLTPQIESASVTVISPNGFEDRSTGTNDFDIRPGENETMFVAEDVDPEEFWVLVSLARDESLVTTELSIEGNPIEISAWPGDEVWANHVTTNIETGLPLLIDTVGLPWPIDDELAVIESYSPYLLGYAGWYDPSTDEIEIGDELNSHLVFHELSHVWFNDDLSPHRWITEGLSDVFGAAVVTSLGEDPPELPDVSLGGTVAQPLNNWTRFDSDPELESWSYAASWAITDEIRDEVGLDVLSDVVQAAANRRIAYVGDGEPETGPRRVDWRVYLDLIENLGQVDDDAIAELFNDWVVRESSKPLLEKRAERREQYRELAAAGDTWAPPLGVRSAMSNWMFDGAARLIASSDAVLERREIVVEVIEPLEASLPTKLEAEYEKADEDLTDVSTLMTQVETAADGLRRSHEEVQRVSGPLRWVGAIGTDYQGDLDKAIAAFENGNLDTATADAGAVEAGVADLQRQGTIRVSIAVVLLIVLLGLVVLIVRMRRRRRRRRAAPPTPELVLAEGVPVGEVSSGEPLS